MRPFSFHTSKARRWRAAALITAFTTALIMPLAAPADATTPPGYTLSIIAGTGASGPTTAGPATTRTFGAGGSVLVDPSGNVFIADPTNHQVYKVTPAGALSIFAGTGVAGSGVAGPATASPLNQPYFLAMDGWGNLYISDYGAQQVYEVYPNGILAVFAGTGGGGAPTPGPALNSDIAGSGGIAATSDGTVYVSAFSAQRVLRITKAGRLTVFAGTGLTGTPQAGPATSSDMSSPDGLAVDHAGNLYIADRGNYRVEKVTPTGALTIVAGSGSSGAPTPGKALASKLNLASSVAVDGSGNLYISDYFNNVVEKVTPAGTLSIIAGTGTVGTAVAGRALSSPLAGPYGIWVDPAGNLYLATFSHPMVVKLAPPRAPGKVTLLSATRNSSTTVTAKFKAGSAGTSPINSYQMGCMNVGGSWHYATSSTSTVKVTTLKAGTVTCRGRAHNAVGYGPWSNTFKR